MRTTVDLSEDQYRALRTLAARRGMRGFSPLLREAVELLLAQGEGAEIDAALALAGTLEDREADALVEHVRDLRARPARTSPGDAGPSGQ